MRIFAKRPTNRRSENRSRPCRARALGTASAVLIAALSSGALAQRPAKRFELADEAKLVRVLDPQLSPDGRSIVIVVGRANYEDDRFDSELVLVDVADGARRVLTNGRKGVKYPRWSPDGRRLAFLAEPASADEAKDKDVHSKKETDIEPHLQIFVMPMDGGDPRQLTHAPSGVQQFAWRPDGGAIAFATADEPVNKDAIEKHDDAFEVGDIDFLSKASPTPTHIWEIDSNGGEAHRLTSGTWSVVTSLPALLEVERMKCVAQTTGGHGRLERPAPNLFAALCDDKTGVNYIGAILDVAQQSIGPSRSLLSPSSGSCLREYQSIRTLRSL